MNVYIGIDPGTVKLGYAVILDDKLHSSGAVKLNPRKSDVLDRIIAMAYQTREIFKRYRSAEHVKVYIEDQYFGHNAQDQLKLARLTGQLVYVCFEVLAVVPEFVHPSKLQKFGRTQSGLSLGEQARIFAKKLYGVDCETEDEAVAICLAELARVETEMAGTEP